MNTSSQTPPRSAAQWIVTAFFGLLCVVFLFRGVQFGSKWLRHVVEGDTNFKAMTLWALVYVVVCGGIAAVAYYMPRGEEADVPQNAERGT